MPERDTLRGFAIIIAVALVATVTWSVSSQVLAAIQGAIGLIFICLMWYFGYGWYHRNRMAISLMPDQQRFILYGGLAAVTISAALYSLSRFNLLTLGSLGIPVLAVFLGGLFAMYYAWNESKRYYL